ncbi:tyrosine-type recombinase/integrase [Xenorhabdus bovienii]|uniref:tyrosine-type recombinase/integrase n=1 Tax=Xenorhabdus bovienii TaxID=40576 RepID=UPI003DA3651D
MAISDTKLRSICGKPYSGQSELSDMDGLGIRISPKGVILFQFRYRWQGKPQRLSLGRYPAVSLREARIVVGDLRTMLDQGKDPKCYKNSETEKSFTVRDCLNYWVDTYVNVSLRKNTQDLYNALVIKHMQSAFEGTPISDITAKQWMERFTEEERINPRRARSLFVQLKSAVSWCIRRQMVDDCPLMKINPKDVGEKTAVGDTVLTYRELARIWLAIERSRAATSNKLLHQMLMLWGARGSELRLSTESEFNLIDGLWSLPAEHNKTKAVIRRPIFSQIRPLLGKAMLTYDNILFPGADINQPITISAANRYVLRLRNTLDMGYWRAHDFRRSLATLLSEEGVAPHVIEKMLGHKLGGIMAVYNKHDWLDEQRDAYELYADKIFWHVKKLTD